jgi:hypothetical protein
MKRVYISPQVTQYGSVGRLTYGGGGGLPDFDADGLPLNDDCNGETFIGPGGMTFSRTSCGNAAGNT